MSWRIRAIIVLSLLFCSNCLIAQTRKCNDKTKNYLNIKLVTDAPVRIEYRPNKNIRCEKKFTVTRRKTSTIRIPSTRYTKGQLTVNNISCGLSKRVNINLSRSSRKTYVITAPVCPLPTATPSTVTVVQPTPSPTPTKTSTPQACIWNQSCCLNTAQLNSVKATGKLNLIECQLFPVRFHGSSLNAQPVMQSAIEQLNSLLDSNQIAAATLVIPTGSYFLSDGLKITRSNFTIKGSGASRNTSITYSPNITSGAKSLLSRGESNNDWIEPITNVSIKDLTLNVSSSVGNIIQGFSGIDFSGMSHSSVKDVVIAFSENEDPLGQQLSGICENCSGIKMIGGVFSKNVTTPTCSLPPYIDNEPVVDTSSAYCNQFERMLIIGGSITTNKNKTELENIGITSGGFTGINLVSKVVNGTVKAPGSNVFSGGAWRIASVETAAAITGIRNYLSDVGFESVAKVGLQIGADTNIAQVDQYNSTPLDPCSEGLGNITAAMLSSSAAYTCVKGGYHEGFGTSEAILMGRNIFANSVDRTKIGSIDISSRNGTNINQSWSAWLSPASLTESSRLCSMGNKFSMGQAEFLGCANRIQGQIVAQAAFTSDMNLAVIENISEIKALVCQDTSISTSIKNGLGC